METDSHVVGVTESGYLIFAGPDGEFVAGFVLDRFTIRALTAEATMALLESRTLDAHTKAWMRRVGWEEALTEPTPTP